MPGMKRIAFNLTAALLGCSVAGSSASADGPGGLRAAGAIHGTNAPALIPGRPSHGCVRVPSLKILELDKLMPVGTPIWIHN